MCAYMCVCARTCVCLCACLCACVHACVYQNYALEDFPVLTYKYGSLNSVRKSCLFTFVNIIGTVCRIACAVCVIVCEE